MDILAFLFPVAIAVLLIGGQLWHDWKNRKGCRK
jgi:hypothetical protein